jgi:hypothetical protein
MVIEMTSRRNFAGLKGCIHSSIARWVAEDLGGGCASGFVLEAIRTRDFLPARSVASYRKTGGISGVRDSTGQA